jgi:hypothetical protein
MNEFNETFVFWDDALLRETVITSSVHVVAHGFPASGTLREENST